jgi:hypothetical protein
VTDITPLIFSVIVATEAPPDTAWAELTRVEVFSAWEALVADARGVTLCEALLSKFPPSPPRLRPRGAESSPSASSKLLNARVSQIRLKWDTTYSRPLRSIGPAIAIEVKNATSANENKVSGCMLKEWCIQRTKRKRE